MQHLQEPKVHGFYQRMTNSMSPIMSWFMRSPYHDVLLLKLVSDFMSFDLIHQNSKVMLWSRLHFFTAWELIKISEHVSWLLDIGNFGKWIVHDQAVCENIVLSPSVTFAHMNLLTKTQAIYCWIANLCDSFYGLKVINKCFIWIACWLHVTALLLNCRAVQSLLSLLINNSRSTKSVLQFVLRHSKSVNAA